jgi:hypothetical protein
MKRWWMVVLLLALSLAVSVEAAAAPKAASFVGAWQAIDGDTDGDGDRDDNDHDGSRMRLSISAGPKGRYHFNLRDDAASMCSDDDDDGPYACLVKGWLTIDGQGRLVGEAPVKCLGKPAFTLEDDATVRFVYDAKEDTLVDNGGTMWRRMGARDKDDVEPKRNVKSENEPKPAPPRGRSDSVRPGK